MHRYIESLYILITTTYIVSEGKEVVRMNGLINQSILLSPSVDSSRPVHEVYWNFQTYIMATYINNQLKVVEDTFEGRLEIRDGGRSLKIGQLRLEDSGLYTATITFTDKSKDQKTYNLTVYDYVPAPTIRIAERKNDGEWCNVTLCCSISANTSTLSYIWSYKHGNSIYQLYNNSGDTIQMSLQPKSWDMEHMCTVHNPADRKNVSVQNICKDYNGRDTHTGKTGRGYYYVFFALLLVPLAFLGWYLIEMKKKRRKDLKKTNEEEINYAELRMAPPNVSTQARKEVCNPTMEPSEDIVYSALRPGTD